MKYLVVGLMALVAVTAGEAAAQETFHGNAARTGVYASSGPERLKGVKWTFKAEASIVASPVVANGAVYVGGADATFYALDESTGALRWKVDVGGPVASTAAVADGVVYFGSYDGTLYALAADTGAVKWKVALGGPERRFAAKGIHGLRPADQLMPDAWDFYTSSPAVVGGVVYVGCGDGSVYALSAATGAPKWKFATGDVVHASPSVAGGTVYVGSWDSNFYALDAATGAERWRFAAGRDPVNHNQEGFQSSAAVADGIVYVGCRDAHVYALDAASGRKLWEVYTDHGWVSATPAVRDGRVYVGTGSSKKFLALDAKTGAPVFTLDVKTGIFSSAAVTPDMAYFGDMNGKLWAVATATGRLAWEFRTESAAKNALGVLGADGNVNQAAFAPMFNDYQDMYVSMFKRFTIGPILSSPVVDRGAVFFTSADGVLYALE